MLLSIGLGAITAVIAWFVTSFVGTPFRRFWDLRGEAIQVLNENARFIPGPPSQSELWFPSPILNPTARQNAALQLRAIGSKMIAFSQNELFASHALRAFGINPSLAGQMFVEASNAMTERINLGPRRDQIAAALRLHP
jgi:hypothetical protein